MLCQLSSRASQPSLSSPLGGGNHRHTTGEYCSSSLNHQSLVPWPRILQLLARIPLMRFGMKAGSRHFSRRTPQQRQVEGSCSSCFVPREKFYSTLTPGSEGSRTIVPVLYLFLWMLQRGNLSSGFFKTSLRRGAPEQLLFSLHGKYPDCSKNHVTPLGFQDYDSKEATLDLSASIQILECGCDECTSVGEDICCR